MRYKTYIFAIVLCLTVPFAANAMKATLGYNVKNPIFKCTPDALRLKKIEDGILLTGIINVPSAGYAYSFSDIFSSSSGPVEIELKLSATTATSGQIMPSPIPAELKVAHLFENPNYITNSNFIGRSALHIHVISPFDKTTTISCVLGKADAPQSIHGEKK